MKLHILFGQRLQSYKGEYAPEALVCWDEFAVDENPEGFENECAKTEDKYASQFSAWRVIVVKVDGDKIVRLLNRAPEIEGTVES